MTTTLLQSTFPKVYRETSELSEFALEVRRGFELPGGKMISPRFLYDDLGSALFEAITLLPQYGLTRADERLLATHAVEIAETCGPLSVVAELGSGNGKKTSHILRAALEENRELCYSPIDVSSGALTACAREIGGLCRVRPVCSDWNAGLSQVISQRSGRLPLLLLFLGSTIGNLDRVTIPAFLRSLRSQLRSGDYLLLGADLEKDVSSMLAAYDDPTGVTAAFNLNLLGRMNRELDADFDIRAFRHEARWHESYRRIEMHLASIGRQSVRIGAIDTTYHFLAGETIWTESSHKFSLSELTELGMSAGFAPVDTWSDSTWPLAEVLWQVR